MATPIPSPEAAVYQRCLDTLAANLTTHSVSPWTYDQLPNGTRALSHLVYAVGVLETLPYELDRQKATHALNTYSRIGVRMLARIRADNAPTDYRLALEYENLARFNLIDEADGTQSFQGPQKWRWTRSTRRSVADGEFLLSELEFKVWHMPYATSI